MLAEVLLLNLLITISPVLIYSVLSDCKHKYNSPFFCGLLHSTAAVACMLFSHSNYGFHWDLRYVPLILSFLYGGPVAGGMVLTVLIGGRLIMGDNTLFFGLTNILLNTIFPVLLMKKFWNYNPNKRVLVTNLIGIWVYIPCFMSLTIFRYFHGSPFQLNFHVPDLFMVGIIHAIALFLSSKLNEGLIERNRMREEILRAEKLNTLGELAASIAHEVRNPLTVVKGFLQLMQKEEIGKNFEYLSLVLSELGRAESIINDYLNFAKPKFEKLEIFQLAEVISEVIMLLDPLAVKQGVQLKSDLDTSDFALVTDRNQLKQAFVNLIKNAIEATPDGGSVTIRNIHNNNHATIFISDTGKGMTDEQLSRIGTLFYTTKDKGTGLGTSVSLRIIEKIKGKVSYKSKPGIGTEVTMILPGGRKEPANI